MGETYKMIDTSMIFNCSTLKNNTENEKFVPILINKECSVPSTGMPIILGSPGMASESRLEKASERLAINLKDAGPSIHENERLLASLMPVVRVVFPFSLYKSIGPFTADVKLSGVLKRTDLQSLSDTELVNSKEFSSKDMKHILDHVEEKSAISFEFEKSKMEHFADKQWQELNENYRDNVVLGYSFGSRAISKKEIDNMSGCVSFLRLDHCIPIFGDRDTSSIGMIIQVFYEIKNKPHPRRFCYLAQIMTNNFERIGVVDGEHILKNYNLYDSMYSKRIIKVLNPAPFDKKPSRRIEKIEGDFVIFENLDPYPADPAVETQEVRTGTGLYVTNSYHSSTSSTEN